MAAMGAGMSDQSTLHLLAYGRDDELVPDSLAWETGENPILVAFRMIRLLARELYDLKYNDKETNV